MACVGRQRHGGKNIYYCPEDDHTGSKHVCQNKVYNIHSLQLVGSDSFLTEINTAGRQT